MTDQQLSYPRMQWATTLDIPLKDSEEVVSIDLENDLPPDPEDLKTLLVEENSAKEHWLTIAISYCNQNKIELGIKLILMALEIFQGPQSVSLHTFLTWGYLKLAKQSVIVGGLTKKEEYLQLSEKHLKEAIGFDATWIGNMLATIDIYYQRRQYDKALETAQLFSKAIVQQQQQQGSGRTSKNGDRPNVLFLLLKAKLFYQKKNYVASLRMFQELLILNPVFHPDPRIGIGLCFWQLKDYKMAIQSWERALEIDATNKNAKILVLLGEFHDTLYSSRNDESFRNNYTKALQDLHTLYVEEENSEGAVSPVLQCLLQSYYYLKGDYKKVIEIYTEKLDPIKDLLPNDIISDACFWVARAYYALKDFKKSFLLFQESLRKNDDNLLSRFGLGQSQLQSNLLEEGILTFESLYKNNESVQELNYVLGLLYAGKTLNETKNVAPLGTSKNIKQYWDKAVQYLEKYDKLVKGKKNQLVILNSYLTLSQLYEMMNLYNKSLEYLEKVVEQLEETGEGIPLEIYNNIGCYYFVLDDKEKALEYFHKAETICKNGAEEIITVRFNEARVNEDVNNVDKAESIYDDILSSNPNYIAARMRHIFVEYSKGKALKDAFDQLLTRSPQNLEVRSLYGWYLKNICEEKVDKETGELLESKHNKETLTKYDSHDLYALVSLGNVYINVARNYKRHSTSNGQKEAAKINSSYLKAIQLYTKVLSLDSYNVFAAQGLAICYAECKQFGRALDILRKLRDSLNDRSVFMNLGHCLTEVGEYVKAVECYTLALQKVSNSTERADVQNLLARVWYLRGLREKNLEYLFKSLEFVGEALSNAIKSEKFIINLKFNKTVLQLDIATLLKNQNVKGRKMQDLDNALNGLGGASDILADILNNEQIIKFFNKDEIEQRKNVCETTLKDAIEKCIQEQKDYENQVTEKMAQAREYLANMEKDKQEQLRREEELAKIKREEEGRKFRELQKEAQQLIQERGDLISDEEGGASGEEKDNDFEAEGDGKKGKKRKSTTKEKSGTKKSKKRNTKRKDEPTDDEDEVVGRRRAKKGAISNEFIEDSDEAASDLLLEKDAEQEQSDNNSLFSDEEE
ncbi:related to RNA polymerase-associated protein CTR9 [Saccharomycodes ludwigii]|uniref:Related to RNA polymerase-associated protein CTR9 n=1 Tax=Saccharomycodes ludwigii TaxID=36035 RepID=A0A376B241_9ASCO|nr:hypothetical protein SCDLUD_004983 [Saccharomycodes ludwigii]KAH3898661.1 hypothetical protein SCDLUD_004983 [Saccharomycodes ludwigii]SSD58755.1 related to RNA polymerase-associated protein CTR9 [Saccharomycodes ludwigii]